LGQHIDDPKRFNRPIISLRLFSDSRLSFGTRFGWVNSLFTVPLLRGTILVLEKNGFASDHIKHCVRKMDLVDKSASLILRQVYPSLLQSEMGKETSTSMDETKIRRQKPRKTDS